MPRSDQPRVSEIPKGVPPSHGSSDRSSSLERQMWGLSTQEGSQQRSRRSGENPWGISAPEGRKLNTEAKNPFGDEHAIPSEPPPIPPRNRFKGKETATNVAAIHESSDTKSLNLDEIQIKTEEEVIREFQQNAFWDQFQVKESPVQPESVEQLQPGQKSREQQAIQMSGWQSRYDYLVLYTLDRYALKNARFDPKDYRRTTPEKRFEKFGSILKKEMERRQRREGREYLEGFQINELIKLQGEWEREKNAREYVKKLQDSLQRQPENASGSAQRGRGDFFRLTRSTGRKIKDSPETTTEIVREMMGNNLHYEVVMRLNDAQKARLWQTVSPEVSQAMVNSFSRDRVADLLAEEQRYQPDQTKRVFHTIAATSDHASLVAGGQG